jgi:hypothetical protein
VAASETKPTRMLGLDEVGNGGRRRFRIPFGRNCPRTVRHDGSLVGMAGSSSRFIVMTVGNHIGAPGRARGALAPAAGCALWYLLTEPVAGHHCAPSGQRALLLGCQRAWASARHIRGPADRPRGRVGLRYPSRPAESRGNSQTQCGERQTHVTDGEYRPDDDRTPHQRSFAAAPTRARLSAGITPLSPWCCWECE